MGKSDFKCSKCGYETGSLESLEWHKTTPECPNFEPKPKSKIYTFFQLLLKNVLLSLSASFLITFVLWGIGALLYGFNFVDFHLVFIIYLLFALLITIIQD